MLNNDFFHIESRSDADGVYTVAVRLNAEHKIYGAHFPGHPITPGVCQIQIVSELLADRLSARVWLTDIKTVKYMAVISPVETPDVEVRFKKIAVADGLCKVMATFESGGQVLSKLSMTYGVETCGA